MPLSPLEVLRKVPLFAGLGEADLTAFAELTRERSYPKGSVIVFEDDPGDALYLVAAGQVKVVIIAEDGREVILSVLGEGSFFGEMAVIDDEPRSAHVIAMEDSQLIVLRREDFRRRVDELRVEADVFQRCGEYPTADVENACRFDDRLFEAPGDFCQRGNEDVAEGVAIQFRSGLTEAILEEAGDERFVVGQGDQTVADVPGRRDVVGATDLASAAAVIGDGNNRREIEVVELQAA